MHQDRSAGTGLLSLAAGCMGGGAIGGAVTGLVEAIYLLTRSIPDLVGPVYAVVLYGLIGVPFGVACAVFLGGVMWFTRRALSASLGWTLAFSASSGALGLVVGRYILNRDVFAEQGVPLYALGALFAVLLVVAGLMLFVVRPLLRAGNELLPSWKGTIGLWGGLALVTGLLALVPVQPDPRANFASGKGVPTGLERAPNTLLIMVDTLRYDHIGAYGVLDIRTPHLDALAADGILFERAYAAASWTRSSGASLLTSRYPSGHTADAKADILPDDVVTIGEALQSRGITTGALINNINMTATFNFDQGFDTFLYESPEYPYFGTEGVFSLSMYKLLVKAGERILGGAKRVEDYYQPADVVFADVLDFAEQNQDGRWMLFAHLMEPHDPFFEHPFLAGEGDAEFNGIGYARAEHESPDPALQDYLRRTYKHEVEYLDLAVGRFVAELKKRGLYDDLAIFLTADHGEEFYEHGGWWHGTTLYEEQIRVPLLVKLPRNAREGSRWPYAVRTIDIAPSIAKLMGAPAHESWKGADLFDEKEWAVLQRSQVPSSEEGSADGEALEGEGAGAGEEGDALPSPPPELDPCEEAGVELDRLVYAEEDFEGNRLYAVVSGRLKRIEANAGNPRGLDELEIYDLIPDGGETENLRDSQGIRCGELLGEQQETLGETLRQVREAVEKGQAVGGSVGTLDPAETARLCALGYLSGDQCE